MEYDLKYFLQQLANSSTEMVLEVKVRLGSVPAERMQIVGGVAEFSMQIAPASLVASLYSKGIVSRFLIERAVFGSQIPDDCSKSVCSPVIADYGQIGWGRKAFLL